MRGPTYFSEFGGLPGQRNIIRSRAVFTSAYAVIPRRVQSDITASFMPGWDGARAWVLARPMSGFAETFAQLIVELQPSGGSYKPEPEPGAEAALFFLGGDAVLTIDGTTFDVTEGAFAYIPPEVPWSIRGGDRRTVFTWVRKLYEPVDGIAPPDPIVTSDRHVDPYPMPDTDGRWSTTRFVDPNDMAHDMHINIVNLMPGAEVPFTETHVMEHGLLVLQGMGVYHLNQDWVEVEAGDFLWLRAFCPQGCHASGSEPFRYLLYKDVNRHVPLKAPV